MSEHFIILGLPRSMTAWVSCFLTCGEVFCQHELAEKMPIEEVFENIPQPFAVSGICDSGLTAHWKKVVKSFPNARYVFLWRRIDHVEKSLENALGISEKTARRIALNVDGHSQDFVDAMPKAEHFNFDELQTPEGATRLWEYCAPSVPLPPAHLAKMMTLKVTVHPKVYSEAVAALNQLV